MPTLDALTTMWAPAMSSADPTDGHRGQAACRLGALGGSIDDPDRCGAGAAEFVDHRASRSPGSDHRDIGTGDLHTVVSKRRHETRTIGTGAHEFVAVPADRVHRAERLGGRVEPVDRSRDVMLVRHRHRQPGEAEHSHRIDRLGCTTRGHVERDVGPVDAGSIERRLVYRPATGCAQTGDPMSAATRRRLTGRRPGGPVRCCARAARARRRTRGGRLRRRPRSRGTRSWSGRPARRRSGHRPAGSAPG